MVLLCCAQSFSHNEFRTRSPRATTRGLRGATTRALFWGRGTRANLVSKSDVCSWAMVSTSTACMGLAAAIGVGTLYVLLHEKKRKRKKLEQHLKDQPISKEMLLKILHKVRRLR